MKTFLVEGEVASDGSLHLVVPAGLPPGKVEVALVVQSLPSTSPPYSSSLDLWKGLFPSDFDLDGALRDVRHDWEGELEELM